jgi:hypothetical protein
VFFVIIPAESSHTPVTTKRDLCTENLSSDILVMKSIEKNSEVIERSGLLDSRYTPPARSAASPPQIKRDMKRRAAVEPVIGLL